MKKGKCEEAGWNRCKVQETYIYVTNTQHPNVNRFYIHGLKDGCASSMRYITLE